MTPRMNLHDDIFTFAIDLVDAEGKRKERLGGMNNVYAAQRAFDELLHHFNAGEIIILRQRGRIMRREHATGGHRERVIAGTSR